MNNMRTMIAGALCALALALAAAGLSACRNNHLGADHGRAYKQAMQDQRTSEATSPTLTAEDASQVLHVHAHGPQAKGATTRTTTYASPGMAASETISESTSSGAWPGASGNISLEAK